MKRVLVVSDLHIGKHVSLCPDEVELNDGGKYISNDIQKIIYGKWEEMVDTVGRCDAVVALGDLCDGVNYRSRGGGLWTTELSTQVSVASDLLSMIKTNKYLGVQGSYYHVGDNISTDRAVMDNLNGTHADELVVNVGGKRLHCCHDVGVSASGSCYRPTPIAREMMVAAINETEYGKLDVILRGHAHYYVGVNFSSTLGIICPCWSGRDSFVARRTLAFNPHLGYILLEIGDDITYVPSVFTLTNGNMREVVV